MFVKTRAVNLIKNSVFSCSSSFFINETEPNSAAYQCRIIQPDINSTPRAKSVRWRILLRVATRLSFLLCLFLV